jgi:hypothetical protein
VEYLGESDAICRYSGLKSRPVAKMLTQMAMSSNANYGKSHFNIMGKQHFPAMFHFSYSELDDAQL